jgi:murein DD-endopeptidase MepM/ murein hydrolase activator NlpD
MPAQDASRRQGKSELSERHTEKPPHAVQALTQRIEQALTRHSRALIGSIGLLLLGTGVTAFGIAPLAPDAADLPVQRIVEPAQTLMPVAGLTEAAGFTLYRSDTVRRDDTAPSLLARLGVNDTAAGAFLRNDAQARQIFTGRQGKNVTAETNDRHELKRLVVRWLPNDERSFQRLIVERQGDQLVSRMESGELTPSVRLSSGSIRSSLFAATDALNLPDSVAVQLAEIFASEIDFRRDLRQGDRFSVVYEALEADGEPMRAGRILSAQFVNDGRVHEAVWFDAAGNGKGAYYSFDGQSSQRQFLSSPLQFSRVSSGYGMRFHPISGQRKAHLGVDYAAPTGTPVRTIGDGVVSFAGWQRGYGNVIEVQHRDGKSTLYAHLSRIDVRKGQKLSQGDFIGAVGSTGLSTGPHLHFEFKDRGVHQDPLEVARKSETIPLQAHLRDQFDQMAAAQRLKLDAAALSQQASAQ